MSSSPRKSLFRGGNCSHCGRMLFYRQVFQHDILIHDDLKAVAELEDLDHMEICPNNAKIWLLDPDMVTLREI